MIHVLFFYLHAKYIGALIFVISFDIAFYKYHYHTSTVDTLEVVENVNRMPHRFRQSTDLDRHLEVFCFNLNLG